MTAPARLLCNYVPGEECRVAITRDDKLEELHEERAGAASTVGNIYVGRVANVERGIQAAFVDFGTGTNGFLHVSDLHPQYFPGSGNDTEQIGQKTPRRERPPIEQCLKRGQKILVQVLKDNISTKGPTLTSYLSIPGRFLVMLPDMDKVGVSRKVEDEDDRRKMRKVLDELELPKDFGFILRTAGVGKTKTDLKRDLAYLQRLWKDIDSNLKKGNKPRLLYAESDLLMRALRDIWTSDIDEIIIDNDAALKRAHGFMRIVAPRSKTKLLRYDRPVPLFHAFNVEPQIELVHAREVPLPSGGSLVVDEAEAMVAIDVNSGKSRSHGDAETTAFRTNQEAVDEICRQLKLRDIGGLLMLDLIDMSKRSNRKTIENRINDRLKTDRASTKALPISQFGIVEMTRQRVRDSFRNQHFTRIPGEGRGWVRRPESVAAAAVRETAALLSHDKVEQAELVVSPKVAGAILSTQRIALTRLEIKSGKKIVVRISDSIAHDRVTFYAYDGTGSDIEIEKLPKFKEPKNLKQFDPEKLRDLDASDADSPETLVLPEPEDQHAGAAAMEAALNADIDDDDDESDDEEGGGKRRRRRRRRRRSGSAEDDTAERRADSDDDDDASADVDSPAADDPDDEDGQPRRKRRRRRRGRGGRDTTDQREGDTEVHHPQDVSPDADDRGTHLGDTPEARSKRKAYLQQLNDAYGDTAPSGYPWRGDSWDLEPSAITINAAGDGFANDDDARLAEALRPHHGNIRTDADVPDADELPDDPRSNAAPGKPRDDDGERHSKKRRRRRGGRGRSKGESDGAAEATSASEAEAKPGAKPDRDHDSRKSRDRRPRDLRANRGGAPDSPQPVVAPTPPAPAPAAKAAAAPASAEVAPAPSTRRINTRRKKKVAPKDILTGVAAAPAASSAKAEAEPADSPRVGGRDAMKAKAGESTTTKKTSRKKTSKKTSSKKAPSRKKTTKKAASKKTSSKKTSSKKRTSRKKTSAS